MSSGKVNGYEYEEYCARYLKRKGFSKVRTTKASGDQGADIVAFRHRHRYAVQCKYYGRPVGNKAVQEVYAGMSYYDCDRAMVITNATFTRSAYELADKLGVELVENVEVENTFRRRAGEISALLLAMIISFALYLNYESLRFPILSAWGTAVLAVFLVRMLIRLIGKLLRRDEDEEEEIPEGEDISEEEPEEEEPEEEPEEEEPEEEPEEDPGEEDLEEEDPEEGP